MPQVRLELREVATVSEPSLPETGRLLRLKMCSIRCHRCLGLKIVVAEAESTVLWARVLCRDCPRCGGSGSEDTRLKPKVRRALDKFPGTVQEVNLLKEAGLVAGIGQDIYMTIRGQAYRLR